MTAACIPLYQHSYRILITVLSSRFPCRLMFDGLLCVTYRSHRARSEPNSRVHYKGVMLEGSPALILCRTSRRVKNFFWQAQTQKLEDSDDEFSDVREGRGRLFYRRIGWGREVKMMLFEHLIVCSGWAST